MTRLPKHRGLFITFEGPDGSGKSTQLRLLAQRLRAEGYVVLESAEPGGTPVGMQIRKSLLDPANRELSSRTELLLMFAARAQNVEQWILPALAEGKLVLSDRFTDSTLAYQGVARGLGSKIVIDLDRIASQGIVPDLTICMDIETEIGLGRAHARNLERSGDDESRLDQQTIQFHRKVRSAYHDLARAQPERIRLIHAEMSPNAIAEKVWLDVAPVLRQHGCDRTT